MEGINTITIVIIAINCLLSFKGFKDYHFFESYKFNIASIKRGEHIRMLSSGFLHADEAHLIFNMFTLYFFANGVIDYLGVFNFCLVYLGSLISGNLLTLLFNKHNLNYNAVGASGAVTGVLYAAILLNPHMRLGFIFLPIPIPAYVFGVGYLLYTIYGMKKRNDTIGHDAHFGGAIGGYSITLFMASWVLTENLLMVVLLAVPIFILLIMKKFNKL